MKTPPCFEDPEAKKVIRELCQKHRIDIELLKDLCGLIQDHSGSGRRVGIDAEIADCFDRFVNDTRRSG